MKISTLILFITICSCSKTSTIIDTDSQQQNISDSAKYFVISASNNNLDKSLIVYNANKVLKWQNNAISPISFWSTPAFGDNKLFFTSTDKLYSLNIDNGSSNWTYTSSVNIINPILKNDTIVTATSTFGPSNQNAILLINKSTGNIIWNKIISNQPIITPVLDGNKIYVVTTNTSGTALIASSYDVITSNLVWQNTLASTFVTSTASQMLVKNDTLIINSPINKINYMNKNTGVFYWSKSLNADNIFLYKNKIVYNDQSSGKLTFLSTQNGSILFESNASNARIASAYNKPLSYIYNDALYFQTLDTLYCSNLSDGTFRWKKPYRFYFQKISLIGNTVYGVKLYENNNNEMKIMIIDAENFISKDSIIVPKRDYINFSIISTNNLLY